MEGPAPAHTSSALKAPMLRSRPRKGSSSRRHTGFEKDGKFIFEQLAKVIEEIGAEHIVAVIMDGASANESANKLLEERYPHIFTLHCTAHALDLALEKIGELQFFQSCIDKAKKVVQIITNSHGPHAILKQKSALRVLKPGDTRFYTAYISCARLLKCKSAARQTVVSDGWDTWAKKPANKDRSAVAKTIILDEDFWLAVKLFCKLLKPMVRLMRLVDSNMPSMGKVYPMCAQIEEHIKAVGLDDNVQESVSKIFRERWDKMHSPLHAAAYMLEPQFRNAAFGREVKTDFRKVAKKMMPDTYVTAHTQFYSYTNNEGVFGDPDLMSMTEDGHNNQIPTYQFWNQEVLARIAQRVTALVSSAGACERNWSTYDFIHSKKRNRLHPDRANDLVFVFTNSRLIQKFKEPERFAEWVQEIESDDENMDEEEFEEEEDDN
ncbi:g5415 [Coccomyxa elongata]